MGAQTWVTAEPLNAISTRPARPQLIARIAMMKYKCDKTKDARVLMPMRTLSDHPIMKNAFPGSVKCSGYSHEFEVIVVAIASIEFTRCKTVKQPSSRVTPIAIAL